MGRMEDGFLPQKKASEARSTNFVTHKRSPSYLKLEVFALYRFFGWLFFVQIFFHFTPIVSYRFKTTPNNHKVVPTSYNWGEITPTVKQPQFGSGHHALGSGLYCQKDPLKKA